MLIVSTTNQNHSLAAREKAASEVVLLENDDHAVIRRLEKEAEAYDLTTNKGDAWSVIWS